MKTLLYTLDFYSVASERTAQCYFYSDGTYTGTELSSETRMWKIEDGKFYWKESGTYHKWVRWSSVEAGSDRQEVLLMENLDVDQIIVNEVHKEQT